MDDSSTVLFVPDQTSCAFTIYLNNEFYRLHSLKNNFPEIISEIIE